MTFWLVSCSLLSERAFRDVLDRPIPGFSRFVTYDRLFLKYTNPSEDQGVPHYVSTFTAKLIDFRRERGPRARFPP